MEYSDLVKAIRRNDSLRVNELMESLLPRLIRFLRIHMNAPQSDAEDCVQESLLQSLEVIKRGNLRNPDRVLSYLLTTCRNNYLKMKIKKRERNYEEVPSSYYHIPGQLTHLLDKEKSKILEWCLDQLQNKYRKFVEFWFKYPDADGERAAKHFGLSINNAWTRKHRIIKRLNDCYQKKSNL